MRGAEFGVEIKKHQIVRDFLARVRDVSLVIGRHCFFIDSAPFFLGPAGPRLTRCPSISGLSFVPSQKRF